MKTTLNLTPEAREILLNGFAETGNPSRRLVGALTPTDEDRQAGIPYLFCDPGLAKLHVPVYRRSDAWKAQEQPIDVDLPEPIFREAQSIAQTRGVDFDSLLSAAVAKRYLKTVIVRLMPEANEELRRLGRESRTLSICVAELVLEPMPSLVRPGAGYRRGLNLALELYELTRIPRGRFSANPDLSATTILMRRDLYAALSEMALRRKSSVNVLINTAILQSKKGGWGQSSFAEFDQAAGLAVS